MLKLRPYQQAAVDATLRHFRRSRDPALIVLPTGAGKSVVIAELARVARGRVLVLAHVKELVEQNHQKFASYGLPGGIYSAGLQQKDSDEKVIFGGIQSVAKAPKEFFKEFSLLVIDECHRVSDAVDTQYLGVIEQLRKENPELCILGLTATPYRLDTGWIYNYHADGYMRTDERRTFKRCVFELTLAQMIREKFLTPPVQIDAPVASYDFSSLNLPPGKTSYSTAEIDAILKDQARITPVIVRNIVELAKERRGVLIFSASVSHAKEVLKLLPYRESAMVLGDTSIEERDEIVDAFKAQKIKYLVNVSVLTTGFDAPHVDLIAILRPTESVSLYQQIVGRGLRLFEGKRDCLVLDYTGVPHDIMAPQIHERRPIAEAVAVKVPCPDCDHENEFWGIASEDGQVLEHFGAKCQGVKEDPVTGELMPCSFKYRARLCDRCGTENAIDAIRCTQCNAPIIDDETRVRNALAAKDTHVLRPDSMTFERKTDKKGGERLEIRYYDLDGKFLTESFFFSNANDPKVFYYNFVRMHLKRPELKLWISSIDEALRYKLFFRTPIFVIARKQDKYWRIREKVFLR